jgi:hypothetical protein
VPFVALTAIDEVCPDRLDRWRPRARAGAGVGAGAARNLQNRANRAARFRFARICMYRRLSQNL